MKNIKIKYIKLAFVLIGFCSFLLGCNSSIAVFDQYAYTQTTSIKIDVMNLMDKSTESYFSHQKDVEIVVSEIMKMKEYEKHRPKDIITYKMWDKIIDSTGQKGLIGKYIAKWKSDTTEKPILINDAKELIGQGFDMIAELESKKAKSSDSNIKSFLK